MYSSLHLLLIDAHESRRSALIDLLSQHAAIGEMRMAASLDNALEQLERIEPDLLLLSLDSLQDDLVEPLLHFSRNAARPALIITQESAFRSALELVKGGISDVLVGTPETLDAKSVVASMQNALDTNRTGQHNDVLARAVMCISDSICITDPHNRIVAVNDSFCQTYGYTREQTMGLAVDSLLPHILTCSEDDSQEIFHTRRDGELFPVTVSWSKVRSPAGKLLSNVAVIRDISRQKRTEEKLKTSLKEKEVLLKEIHHRVKNNLQVISSLLNLQSSFLEDRRVAEALRDSQNRVKSMALIHELLYRSDALNKIDFKDYIRSLVSHVSGSYKNRGDITIDIEIADLVFNVDFAIPCGLIINELLSNALKHAFPQGAPGTIRIELNKEILDGITALRLTFKDNGIGLPEDIDVDSSRSLGLQLVRMLTQQVKGQLSTITGAGEGVQFAITFPA